MGYTPWASREGEAVIIRTVTNYYVGELVEGIIGGPYIRLTRCSWVADTGRWSVALATGHLAEVEPYPAGDVVLIAAGAVVDIAPWHHDLPTEPA